MGSCEGPSAEELRARAGEAREMLRACALCEKRCGVDRISGAAAPCGLGSRSWTFKRHISFAEELELLPSYMVYLGGCNFRCQFCVQAPDCFCPDWGTELGAAEGAADFEDKVRKGAKTINLLGGEPSLHLHTLLDVAAAAAERGVALPLVLNSNMYMSPRVIELLDGVVTMYLADFKFGNDACARNLAGVERYTSVVTRNLVAARGRAEVLVRHLVMPGHIECCLRPVATWMLQNLPGVRFHAMFSYVPAYRAGSLPVINRVLTDQERQRAQEIVDEHRSSHSCHETSALPQSGS